MMSLIEPSPTKPAVAPRKPVLLIVDDEPGPRESLRFVFNDRFDCVIATCGREGLECARSHPVEVAILDIRMPDMSGVDVLRALKITDPDIECVLLTGCETIETARAAVRYGAAEYLNKPYDVFTIREVVDRCLARREEKRRTRLKLDSLQQINGDLSQAISDQSRTTAASTLSAGIVHELNNPLTIISGYIELLDRDLIKLQSGDASATQDIHHRFAAVQREILRCREIAQRFLLFARSPKNQPENVNVIPLIEDTALLLRAHPDHKKCHLVAKATGPTLTTKSTHVELMQILINLGVNALQAMNGEGTLTFTAAPAPAPANPLFRAPNFNPQLPLLCLSVTDTGCGIAPENIQKIFTPHFTTKSNGNGLGLPVVAGIVTQYHGAIELLTGSGTTFNVYLPLAT